MHYKNIVYTGESSVVVRLLTHSHRKSFVLVLYHIISYFNLLVYCVWTLFIYTIYIYTHIYQLTHERQLIYDVYQKLFIKNTIKI